MQMKRGYKRRLILTAIDESVIVLVVCRRAVALPLEVNRGNALGATVAVVVKGYLTERADG